MPLPPAAGLALSEAERKELVALRRQRSSSRGIVLRINIVLEAAEGLANRVVARKLSTSVPTVWRKRFETDGIAGLLEDRQRSGRPKRISEQREAAIVEATMKTTPKDATQWSVRAMAAAQKVSSATCSESGRNTSCNHIASNCSSSIAIRSLRGKFAISSDFI